MLGKRSIDDLLGPAGDDADGRGSRAGGWLREWPLLLGLACSLGLIGGAMLVGAPDAPPVAQAKASPAAAADYSAGEVVDVGEDDAAETAAEPPGTAPAKPGKRGKSKRPKASSGAATDGAQAQPSSDASAGSGGGGTTPRKRPRSGRAPSTDGPTTAKIVNVTGTSASITNGPLAYTLTAPTHSPTVGTPWRLSVTATRNGKPLTGRVKIDILHQGSIVGHAANGALRGGRFANDFPWPKEAVGQPLTVKTTISGGGVQQTFLFDVKVKAAG